MVEPALWLPGRSAAAPLGLVDGWDDGGWDDGGWDDGGWDDGGGTVGGGGTTTGSTAVGSLSRASAACGLVGNRSMSDSQVRRASR